MQEILSRSDTADYTGKLGVIWNLMPYDTVKAVEVSGTGSATVYFSISDPALIRADIAAGNITSGNTADWDAWTPGTVTSKASTVMAGKALCAVLVVTVATGVWRLEATYERV